jgi:hypothetical protein
VRRRDRQNANAVLRTAAKIDHLIPRRVFSLLGLSRGLQPQAFCPTSHRNEGVDAVGRPNSAVPSSNSAGGAFPGQGATVAHQSNKTPLRRKQDFVLLSLTVQEGKLWAVLAKIQTRIVLLSRFICCF